MCKIVKAIRIKNNLNQKQLCSIAGIGINTLVKIEKGDIDGIRFGILKKVAAALNSSFEELFLNE